MQAQCNVWCSLLFRCRMSCLKKFPKIVMCKQNAVVCDVFRSRNPKIEPKHWYLKCFRNNQKANDAKTPLFAHIHNTICQKCWMLFLGFWTSPSKTLVYTLPLKNFMHKTPQSSCTIPMFSQLPNSLRKWNENKNERDTPPCRRQGYGWLVRIPLSKL